MWRARNTFDDASSSFGVPPAEPLEWQRYETMGGRVVNELIEQGLRQHRAGRLQEAKTIYEQVLALQPRHPDALHLAGVVALESGDAEGAAALIQQAIEAQPGNPAFHANLAQACLALQRVAQAHAAFQRAAALDPRNPQFALGAANCLAMQGRVAEAEQQLRGLVQRHPGYALAWFNLAHAVRDQGRLEEAAGLYRRAIELEPASADAHSGLGGVLHALERFEDAERAYRQHLALQPDSVAGCCNLASLLIDRGRFADAAALCQQALARALESAELHLMLGSALAHQGQFTAALGAFRAAVHLAPDNARARWAYGTALFETGDSEQGLEWLTRTLELQPDSPEFRYALSGVYLALGDLQAGWMEYAWRTARQRFAAEHPELHLARELPDSVSGRNICLLREQGFGDELFFLRFAAMLKSRGAHITYRAQAKIASILERAPVLDRVIAPNDALPAADLVLLLGDLPHALGRLDSSPLRPSTSSRPPRPGAAAAHNMRFPRLLRVYFPEPAPPLALAPLPERLERIMQRLAALGPPPYVGITWRAGTVPEEQRGTAWSLHKQIPLEPLGATLRGVNGTWLALQRDPQSGEIGRLAAHLGNPVHDLSALNEDLEAMLALLGLIDDYVGVSNTNMHLRAGVGRTARVLVPRPAEWRWMAAGNESPWFPGFRVYRQQPSGSWDDAFERLRDDLFAQFGRSARTDS